MQTHRQTYRVSRIKGDWVDLRTARAMLKAAGELGDVEWTKPMFDGKDIYTLVITKKLEQII